MSILCIEWRWTDGSRLTDVPERWPKVRSEGIDQITFHLDAHRRSVVQGASVYWFYRRDEDWVYGWGNVGVDKKPLKEVVTRPDGTQMVIPIDFMPDLQHNQLKLGWWRG